MANLCKIPPNVGDRMSEFKLFASKWVLIISSRR